MIKCAEYLTIFKELEDICTKENYGNILLELYNEKKLNEKECTLLLGLMVKRKDFSNIFSKKTYSPDNKKTKELCEALHRKILNTVDMVKETAYYSAVEPYPFQYLIFALIRYFRNDELFKKNKGYSLRTTKNFYGI